MAKHRSHRCPVVVEGLSAAIPEQLQEYALEVVQLLIDENVDMTSLPQEIGAMMLVEGARHAFPLANVMVLVGIGIAGLIFLDPQCPRKHNNKRPHAVNRCRRKAGCTDSWLRILRRRLTILLLS